MTSAKTRQSTWSVEDPIGEAYIRAHSAAERRKSGSTYTPLELVELMVSDARRNIEPELVVDCGCGSGRFAIAAARAFPEAKVYAIDSSPAACEMCLRNVEGNGLEGRVEVRNMSFMDFELPERRGKALWIGNPPYVRHHEIGKDEKDRFRRNSERLGIPASSLSGLHVHFIGHILDQWRSGDFAELVTSAEWLDVGYGGFVRSILSDRLPARRIRLFDRNEQIFEGTDSTAVVFSFSDNKEGEVELVGPDRRSSLHGLSELRSSERWSPLFLPRGESHVAKGLVPLGSIASVHRGVVTGNNDFWVRPAESLGDVPEELTTPIVAKAREIKGECVAQAHPENLKRLIVLPDSLDSMPPSLRSAAERILEDGVTKGVDRGYVARSRRAWWSVKPPKAPAIMMTYMSRSAPTFVMNERNLPMLNTIHGLYPKVELSEHALEKLTSYLNSNVGLDGGRTYCGGLVKYEPREVEAIMVPPVEALER